MSTFKKVLSLVLALTMVFSTVAVAFAADSTEETYYAGNESVIDTMADFAALGYDKTQQKFYMYLGVDYYEQNESEEWVLTDHYVQPGAQLRGEVHFKTNMYTGSGMAIFFNFDRDFFDITNGKGATYPSTPNNYDPDQVKYPTAGYPNNIAHNSGDGTAINTNNPIVTAEGINYKYTTNWARNVRGFMAVSSNNFHPEIPLTESDEWDLWYVNVGTDTNNTYAFEFETDEYFFTFDVKVREFLPDGETKLADGTTGNVTLDKRCWTIYDNAAHAGTTKASKRVGNIGTYFEEIKESSIKRMNLQNWFTINDFYTDDCNHTFTIGEPKGTEVTVTDGDTVLFQGELLAGATLKLDTVPSKENYVFVGLTDGETTYSVDAATGEVQGFVMGSETVALTAVYEGKPVTAVFNYNDGATANLTTTIKYNDVVAEDANYPADPTRENYTFAGWAVNGTVIDDTFTMPATTTTFVAQWAVVEADYTVNYYTMNADREYGEPEAQTFSAGIGETVTAVQNAPEGYVVDTALSVLSGTVAADGSLVLNVYYALAQKPVYTITFDANGGSAVEAISAEEGTLVSAPAVPTMLGYEFTGWVDANGEAVEFPYELTESVEFTATWSVLQFTITYLVDGEEYDSVTADFGADVTAPADPTKTGYVFTEWYPEVPATMPAEDLAIEAHFVTGKFDAVFYVDGEVYKTVSGVEFNTAITAPTDPIKTGYTFTGWEPEVAAMDEEGKEFNATFEINQYTVSFNSDGGSEVAAQTLDFGSAVAAPEAPTKTGYTFAGWTLQNNPVDFATFTVPANNVTLKATWTANTYKASFYVNKGDAEAYSVVDIKYNTRLNCAAPEAPAANLYFDGWYNAETDEAASANAGTALGNYLIDGDSAYYAKWTEYPNKIIIKVKNFTTGEWTDLETLYAKSGSLSVTKLKDIKASVNPAEDLGWDGKVSFARGDGSTSMSFNETYASADIISEAVAYEGTKVLYLHAFPIYELEYQLPVYDEATGTYTDEYTTVVKELKPTSFTESGQININKRDVVPAFGYVFDKWTTEDGATPDFFDSGSNYVFNVSIEKGAKLTIKGSFKLEEYEIRFLIGTSDGQAIIPVGVNTIGAVLNAETAEFVYATGANKGQTRALPEVGVVNEEMAEPVPGKEGHKLIGWYLTNAEEFIDVNNFEITPELAATAITPSSGNKYILVNSKWEAQNYDAKFYFWAEGSTIDNPIYTEDPIIVSAPVGTSRDNLVKMLSDADIAKLNASVPEGVTLSTTWRNEDGTTASNNLAVGGSSYYAIYDTVQFIVYVDWNSREDDTDWFVVDDQKVYYGDDTMRGEYNSVDRGVYHYVTSGLQITDLERPTPAHEIVGWKTYHVKDSSTVKDPSTWLEGTNDEGTTIVRDTIIYQAQWKAHKDFFFRVYDMSGNLSMALGKDFKMYYWKDSRIADKDRATLKTIDSMLILLLVPKFENGSLRLDPFYLAKDLFQLKNIGGLFKALFTAIGTLIKGT